MPEWVVTAKLTPATPGPLARTVDNGDGTVTLWWHGDAATAAAALTAVQRHVREAAGGAVWHHVEVSTRAEYDSRRNDPPVPPLVAVKDIAARLGVSHQRASVLSKRRDLFPTVVETAAGAVFLAADLERVAMSERRPGRVWPPKG